MAHIPTETMELHDVLHGMHRLQQEAAEMAAHNTTTSLINQPRASAGDGTPRGSILISALHGNRKKRASVAGTGEQPPAPEELLLTRLASSSMGSSHLGAPTGTPRSRRVSITIVEPVEEPTVSLEPVPQVERSASFPSRPGHIPELALPEPEPSVVTDSPSDFLAPSTDLTPYSKGTKGMSIYDRRPEKEKTRKMSKMMMDTLSGWTEIKRQGSSSLELKQEGAGKEQAKPTVKRWYHWRPRVIMPNEKWYKIFWYWCMFLAQMNAILSPYQLAFTASTGFA